MPDENAIDHDTFAAQVYETLRREILSGALAPSTRLVRRKLGKRLGVSAIPVGEALLRLEHDGLIESQPRSGARVRSLSLQAVASDQALRQALECEAARLCAENATEAQLRELYTMADTLDALLASGDERSEKGMKTHLDYHLAVARFSGYEVFVEELRRVWLRRFVQLNWINAIIHPVPSHWHRQLTDAIATRDPAFAEAKMRHHVRYSIDQYLDAIRKIENASPTSKRKRSSPACKPDRQ